MREPIVDTADLDRAERWHFNWTHRHAPLDDAGVVDLAREFATVRELACADELGAIKAIVNAILQRKAHDRGRALAAGDEDVAACRESDVETCYEILRGLEEREAS